MKGKTLALVGIPLALIAVVVLAFGYMMMSDNGMSVENAQVTNVTESAFTLVWTSEDQYVGEVVVKKASESWSPVFAQSGLDKFSDDRDVELNDEGEYVEVEGGAVDRYTHHVTIRELEPETEYMVRVAGKFNGKDPETENVTTIAINEDLKTPDPAYGKVEGVGEDAFVILVFNNETVTLAGDYFHLSDTLSKDLTYSIDVNGFGRKNLSSTDLLATVYSKGTVYQMSFTEEGYKPLQTVRVEASSNGDAKVSSPLFLLTSAADDCTGKNCDEGSCFTGDNPNDGGWGCNCLDGRVLGPDTYVKTCTDVNVPDPTPDPNDNPVDTCSDGIAIGSGGFGCSAANGKCWVGGSGHCNICDGGSGKRFSCGTCGVNCGGGYENGVPEPSGDGEQDNANAACAAANPAGADRTWHVSGTCPSTTIYNSKTYNVQYQGTLEGYGGQCCMRIGDGWSSQNQQCTNAGITTQTSFCRIMGAGAVPRANCNDVREDTDADGTDDATQKWTATFGSTDDCWDNSWTQVCCRDAGIVYDVAAITAQECCEANSPNSVYQANCSQPNESDAGGRDSVNGCWDTSWTGFCCLDVNKQRFSTVPKLEATIIATSEAQGEGEEPKVTESGRYAFFSEGERIGEKTVVVGPSGEATIKLYIDSNGNGKKDPDEEFITDYSQITIAQESALIEYTLDAGWNLINIPAINTSTENTIVTAGDLLKNWNSQSDEIDLLHIARFRDGQFDMFTLRESGNEYANDFDLIPGEALFVLNNEKAGTVTFEGNRFESAVPFDLVNGWNMVGIVSPGNEYDSEEILTKIADEGTTADTITMHESGLYTSVVKEGDLIYGNNFNVVDKKGYFIRVTEGGGVTFTP